MPDVLGIEVDRGHTVGGIAHELRDKINRGKLDPTFDKAGYLESKTIEIIVETEKFDLIVMSKSEGEGCYCFINSAISGILDNDSIGLRHHSHRYGCRVRAFFQEDNERYR